MKTKIVTLDDKASEALDFLLEPDSMSNRIEIFEAAINLALDVANGTADTDPKKLLRLITEYRDLINDYKTITKSLKKSDT